MGCFGRMERFKRVLQNITHVGTKRFIGTIKI